MKSFLILILLTLSITSQAAVLPRAACKAEYAPVAVWILADRQAGSSMERLLELNSGPGYEITRDLIKWVFLWPINTPPKTIYKAALKRCLELDRV